ncbi:hypothetical protein SHIRM173S_05095 [Streptomyces hirsutus]
MAAVTRHLEEIRGEKAPEVPVRSAARTRGAAPQDQGPDPAQGARRSVRAPAVRARFAGGRGAGRPAAPGRPAPGTAERTVEDRETGHRAGRGAEHVSKPVKAAVFGTGSWGTAFGMVLADAGCDVVLWARRPGLVEAVNSTRTNPDYLPGVELPANLRATADAAEAARDADFTVLAIPSQTLRGNLAGWKPLLAPDTVLVSLMKGVELGSAMRMSEVIEDVAGVGADDHRGHRPQPRPGDRRQDAGRSRGRLRRRGRRPAAPGRLPHAVLPPVHQRRRRRLRTGRRREERDRAGRRHRGRHGARRQRQGLAHHPRARRGPPSSVPRSARTR